MTDIANENNVDYRKLTYRINKGMKIEDAINDIKTSEKKPSIIYNYGRQKFDFISNFIFEGSILINTGLKIKRDTS